MMRSWFSLLGLAFSVAGLDKLLGIRSYERMPRDLGWSEETMRLVGASELVGGLMLTCRWTRRLGGMILVGTSAAVLASELTHDQGELALPRLAVLGAAMTAFCPTGRRA